MDTHLNDLQKLEELYRSRWVQHGVSEQTLGWTKGKQDIRFDILLSGLTCERRSFLDVGCGFGDLNVALRERAKTYEYVGLDIVTEFLEQGRVQYGREGVSFMHGDFMSAEFARDFDYILASGIFAFQLTEIDNYLYIENVLRKMLTLCRDAVSVNFLSDRVNFQRERTFYANPARILDIALGMTRNVRLRHDYMPFEFSVTLFKDASFTDKDTVFHRYIHEERTH